MLIRLTRSLIMGFYFIVWDFSDYFLSVLKFYYKVRFALTDLFLHIMYPLTAADRICFSYLKDYPPERSQVWYGETSLRSFQKILRTAEVTAKDHLFELGSGRGRLVFWASAFIGCETTGIDLNPTFIERAKRIQKWLNWQSIHFYEANFLDIPLHPATVIYLYGSAFESPSWPNILATLLQTRPGTRIITVSKSLAQWGDSQNFECIQTIWVNFVWGKAPVYIQVRQ